MLIQKQLNGDVWLTNGGSILAGFTESVTLNLSWKRAGVEVVDVNGKRYYIELNRVAETQVLPAAAVPFTGDLVALWTLLTGSFFNELHAGVLPTITSDDVVNNSTVTGVTVTDALDNLAAGGGLETNITATGVNYSILSTDYIIYATAPNISIRLPSISTDIGQYYRVFANNNPITILCDDPAGDRITGQISVTMKKYDSATFRALYSNQWLIAD